jgi:hypothetical protein
MPRTDPMPPAIEENVRIETNNGPLNGDLVLPDSQSGRDRLRSWQRQ